MATTLANIILDVQFYLNDSQFAAAQNSAALRIMNTAYQDFAGIRKWKELYYADTSLVTVAGQETYTWPTTVTFQEEPVINLKVTNQQNYPYRLWPVVSEDEWDAVRRTGQGRPSRYRRYFVNGVETLAIRQVPNIAADTIEIVGQKEITEFVGDGSAADTTPFSNKQSDRALAMWIAMFFKMQRGDDSGAMKLRSGVMVLLPPTQFTPNYRDGEYLGQGVGIR